MTLPANGLMRCADWPVKELALEMSFDSSRIVCRRGNSAMLPPCRRNPAVVKKHVVDVFCLIVQGEFHRSKKHSGPRSDAMLHEISLTRAIDGKGKGHKIANSRVVDV